MINQKAISAKIDTLTYAWLVEQARREGRPKNRVINQAIAMYVRVMRARQVAKRSTPEETRRIAMEIGCYAVGLEPTTLF